MKLILIDGKFIDEPSCHIFTHKGLVCVILRMTHTLTLNGYVGVDKEHLLYGKSYWDYNADVHGGLTYSEKGLSRLDIFEDLWFFGFDTNHLGDKAPLQWSGLRGGHGTYRDFTYVREEVINLADQIHKSYSNQEV